MLPNFSYTVIWTLLTLALMLQLFFVITNNRPITALLNLVTLTLTTSIILLVENVCFLPWVFIIIYVGAVAMLFLFIVMLMSPTTKTQQLWKGLTFWVLLLVAHMFSNIQRLFVCFRNEKRVHSVISNTEDTTIKLAISMYENNFALVILLTILLLATLLCSFILARK